MRMLHFTAEDENAKPNEFIILTDDDDVEIEAHEKDYGREGFILRYVGDFTMIDRRGLETLPLDMPLIKEP